MEVTVLVAYDAGERSAWVPVVLDCLVSLGRPPTCTHMHTQSHTLCAVSARQGVC